MKRVLSETDWIILATVLVRGIKGALFQGVFVMFSLQLPVKKNVGAKPHLISMLWKTDTSKPLEIKKNCYS